MELFRKAPAWQPRSFAVICFGLAALVGYVTVFPVTSEAEVSRRLFEVGISLAAGVVYWVFAPHFRVWTIHLVLLVGFVWVLVSLGRAPNGLIASLTLVVVLWLAVFVASAFSSRIVRAYMVLICAEIGIGMALNGVAGAVPIGLAFAGTFVVVMELLSRATNQLRREATTDSLTGLLNRTGLEREVQRVRSFGRDDRIAVLVADLDGFKAVNDRDGHRAGDLLLQEFAEALRRNTRVGDLIARIGGDEFVVVFPEVEEEAAQATLDRLRDGSPAPYSRGLVIARSDESLESCIARADRLLYAEKAAKRASGGVSGRLNPASATAG